MGTVYEDNVMNHMTISLPEQLYRRLERVAAHRQMRVQELVTETLQATLPEIEGIPPDIQDEILLLDHLGESELQLIATGEMTMADQEALEQLLDLQSVRELHKDEAIELERLRGEYGRVLIRKARAYALLAEKGHSFNLQ